MNPQCPAGFATTFPATGTDAPTQLNYPFYITPDGWEIYDSNNNLIAFSGRYSPGGGGEQLNGWTVSSLARSSNPSDTTPVKFTITPPAGLSGVNFELKATSRDAYGFPASAFFDVFIANIPQVIINRPAIYVPPIVASASTDLGGPGNVQLIYPDGTSSPVFQNPAYSGQLEIVGGLTIAEGDPLDVTLPSTRGTSGYLAFAISAVPGAQLGTHTLYEGTNPTGTAYFDVVGPPPPPAPTLTATPTLIGNVPAIVLSGS